MLSDVTLLLFHLNIVIVSTFASNVSHPPIQVKVNMQKKGRKKKGSFPSVTAGIKKNVLTSKFHLDDEFQRTFKNLDFIPRVRIEFKIARNVSAVLQQMALLQFYRGSSALIICLYKHANICGMWGKKRTYAYKDKKKWQPTTEALDS